MHRTSSEPLSDSMELPTSNARNPLNFESFQLEAMWDMAAAYGSAHRSGDTRLELQSATTSHNVPLWDDGFAPPAISSSPTSASSSPSDAHPIPGSSSPKSRDSESLKIMSDPRVVVNPTDNRISKKFKCGICEKTYTAKHNLQSHINYKHFRLEKKIQCEYCGRRFTESRAHIRHLKNRNACPQSPWPDA
ncbi:hypothetical protein GGU10DRAFT_337559 [Lentinula aff. detonsa]|uniref:C2H2-type domain-containing protein n=1 Tax=Lentinula aff. detonsa TaxID=2804958 RepID=A0AA38KBD2_9AGAR|nr:hypothetical protein GGU10DRAFT_337559 [Lentinula aff. detonsa]